MNLKVSIIMATYNRANFIAETLMAIQNQTFTDWECLIIDDGGTDNTQEVIANIITQDTRFKFFKRTDNYVKGTSGSKNFGLDHAKGDYIIFFDDDDIPHPQNLELCVKELADDSIYFCRYGRSVFLKDFHYNFDYSTTYNSFYIDIKDIYNVITNDLHIVCTSVMWKKECFTNHRFVENLIYGEEWELYSRIISNGFKGVSIDKILFYARKHPNSITGAYYQKNKIIRESYTKAIVLVIINLKEKQLLNYFIIRYFIVMSFNFKEFNLFKRILDALDLSLMDKIQWQLFYNFLYIRLPIYRIKASYKRRNQRVESK